eukprot:3778143-Pyramimonas_sp.AAC.1
MRVLPLGPSVELHLGYGTCEGCAEIGGWNCMRALPLRPSVELHLGRGTCEGCAGMEVDLQAGAATGAFGKAPPGATKRARGALK